MNPDDLTELLRSWPFAPGRVNARRIKAADGRSLIQVRIDLGILQMEADGRPDGVRPEGAESLLELHLARRAAWVANHGSPRGFTLDADECAALRDEAVQYYHRYVALLVLEEHDAVIRDTTRNLRAFDLCAEHGATASDRTVLEQFRPYVLMMRTRAAASAALGRGAANAALAAIDAGLDEIRAIFHAASDGGSDDAFERSNEVRLLRSMREMLVPRLPTSERGELQERLRAAIAAENYELAAILRDELRMLDGRRRPE